MILQINPEHPQPRRIERVAETLRSGGVIAYPTDTVYGLGCDIGSKKALDKVRRIKKMDNKRHLTFIFPDLKQISNMRKWKMTTIGFSSVCCPARTHSCSRPPSLSRGSS